ncbi:MAG: hypothetical protein ABI744_07295 [Chloroflexota bacterium]
MVAGAVAISLSLSLTGTVSAHPLGNFTINVYDGLTVTPQRTYVDHVVDMAELPTVEARNAIDVNSDGALNDDEGATWALKTCTSFASGLVLSVVNVPTSMRPTEVGLSFPPGQAGLTTLRLVCGFEADYPTPAQSADVSFMDNTFAGHQGWREITVSAAGTTLGGAGDYGQGSSNRLRSYPVAAGGAIRAQTDARFTVEAVAGAPSISAPALSDAVPVGSPPNLVMRAADSAAAVPGGVTDLPAQLTDIIQAKDLSAPAVLLSLLLALVVGGVHAATPGHGKTLMAAYLVGSRGTTRHALALGLTVTISHTIGVLTLGVLVVLAGAALPASQLFPVLGLVSGVIVMGLGAIFLGQRIIAARRTANAHNHDHESAGEHAGHNEHADDVDDGGWHAHGLMRHTHLPDSTVPLRSRNLVALGLVGGLVPSASAILLLVGSIAVGRPAYGILLTIAFGIGMAGVLVGVGVLLVRARALIERMPSAGGLTRVLAYAPVLTGLVFVVVGAAITVQAGSQLR